MADQEKSHKEYWSRNLRLLGILLTIWFIASCLLSIILVEPLNKIQIAGFPLGMWFAQQGSIVTFIVLCFVYCRKMDKLDREFNVDEREE
jgi:putative solute:sodium symporter small subunit